MKKLRLLSSSFMFIAGVMMLLYQFYDYKLIAIIAGVCFFTFGLLLIVQSLRNNK